MYVLREAEISEKQYLVRTNTYSEYLRPNAINLQIQSKYRYVRRMYIFGTNARISTNIAYTRFS